MHTMGSIVNVVPVPNEEHALALRITVTATNHTAPMTRHMPGSMTPYGGER